LSDFLDIFQHQLNRYGEELCGDKVRILKTPEKSTIVMSDGLGSGVKASILANLTTAIIETMLKESASLEDVLETVMGTLPTCKVRKIAYATFTIIEIFHPENRFRVTNFDNPPVFHCKKGKIIPLETKTEMILDKHIEISEGQLERGDFLGIASDGVLYAGLGVSLNFGWGWENVAKYIENIFERPIYAAHSVVNDIIAKTNQLYGYKPGDDATFVGLFSRHRNAAMVFTGPPLDESHDYIYVDRLLDFEGKRIVCGGTTGNIVASFLKTEVETDLSTVRDDIPPVGSLPQIDLVTEGIITMAKALELLRASEGNLSRIKPDRNGAYLLTRELLLADDIHFLVGQQINAFYQSPLVPKNISIRRTIVNEIADLLRRFNKDVTIDYC
jgi:hypothetical protein